MQYKSGIPIHIVKADGATKGEVEAFVSVFGNIDSYNERIVFGAFADSIKSRTPKVIWSHDTQRPVGKTTEIEEVPAGDSRLPDHLKEFGALRVKGAFALNTRDGLDAYEHLNFGSFDEFSIGYEVKRESLAADGVKELHEIVLYEWSPVLVGANPLTSLINVKNLSHDDKAEAAVLLLSQLIGHTKALIALRQKEGRALSAANRGFLGTLADNLEDYIKQLRTLLKDTEPTPKADAKARVAIISHQLQLMNLN